MRQSKNVPANLSLGCSIMRILGLVIIFLQLTTFVAFGDKPQGKVTGPEDCADCHYRSDCNSREGKSRFIDPGKYAASVHAIKGVICVSCHEGITEISRDRRIPHKKPAPCNCAKCHEAVYKEYANSRGSKIGNMTCASCHSPHFESGWRHMSAEAKKEKCLECHDIRGTHRYLPQKDLHFRYLACTSCHALHAKIGMVLFFVERANPSKLAVPLEYKQLEKFVETGKNGLLESLDPDGNGMVTGARILSLVEKMRKNGIPAASLRFRILVMRPSHVFTNRNEKTRNCTLCHSEKAEFYSSVVLSVPEKDGTLKTIPVSKDVLRRPHDEYLMGDFYLLGESKIRKDDLKELLQIAEGVGYKWVDILGCLSIGFVMAAVCLHATLILLTKKMRESVSREEDRPKSLLEKAWHWIQGLCMTFLVVTGIQLRYPDVLPVFTHLQNAVELHNCAGILIIMTHVFWLVYRLRRRDLKDRLLIPQKGIVRDIANTLHYYCYSVFIGERLSQGLTWRAGSDPLQKFVIMIVAFFLIPGQILTGILLLDVQNLMPIINKVGGLRFVDALHISFAYLLIPMILIHVYINTLRRHT